MTTIHVRNSLEISGYDKEKCSVAPRPGTTCIAIDNETPMSPHAPVSPPLTTLGAPAEQLHQFPEGGLKAHLTVLGAFIALACTFGQLSAFGTFQTWYTSHQLQHLPASTISWIGSLQLWIFFFSVRFNFNLSFKKQLHQNSLSLFHEMIRVLPSDAYSTHMGRLG